MNIGTLSHTVALVALALLFILLLTSWRGRLQGALLVVAVLTNLIWAGIAAWNASSGFQSAMLAYVILEVVRNVAWLVFLFQLLQPLSTLSNDNVRLLLALRPWAYGLAGLVLLGDLFPQHLAALLTADFSVDLRIFGHLGLAVGGLALIEQLFRNTRPDQRWATKFLYLGIGMLFAYDFFLYADALLFKRIDHHIWSARGLVNAMVVPFIAVSAARNPQWSLSVFVSRRIVIHSATVFGAGLYLLLMAAFGYYIRLYGGAWGTAVQMAFLFGAGALLVVLMFSGQLRAYIKVFLSKHFFNYKYDYREEWLKFINTLSTNDPDMPVREKAILAIAEIVDSPGGMLWTRNEAGNYLLSASLNMNEGRGSLRGDSEFIKFIHEKQWVIDIDEVDVDAELYAEFEIPSPLRNDRRAWIIVPLMQGDRLEGIIVLAKPRAKRQINWEDRDLLRTAGRQLANYVAFVAATDALVDARQFEAFNRLSAFVVHDLKNVSAQLSLVVANASRHKHNPAFIDDAIATVENATNKMNRMLDQLRKGGLPVSEAKVFTVAEALGDVIKAQSHRRPVPVLVDGDTDLRLQASRERFVTVLQHLVQNAQEATQEDGAVKVRASRQGKNVLIAISDTGCGMDERFIRECLFRPFNTTKGNAGMGIGVYESREFINSLGGEIDVDSKLGEGSTFILRIPEYLGADHAARDVNHAVRC